jgi:hypothetical protein
MAVKRHIKIVAADDFTRRLLDLTDEAGYLHIEGASISVLGIGDEPHNLRLMDSSGHLGTVAAGIVANVLFVQPFNDQYDANIVPLTDAEILEDAGITSNVSSLTSNIPRSDAVNHLSSINSDLLIRIATGIVFILLAVGFLKFRRH